MEGAVVKATGSIWVFWRALLMQINFIQTIQRPMKSKT